MRIQDRSSDTPSTTLKMLRELQEAATHSDHPVADVLRMCLRLSSRIESEQLREWASLELRGYSAVAVPDYRVLSSRLIANYTNIRGQVLSHFPVPLPVFEPHEYEELSNVHMRDPVSRVSELINSENLGIHLSPERVALLQQRGPILDGWMVSQVWQEVNRASLVAILDQVRTGALEFACELERSVNLAVLTGSNEPLSSDSIINIFNTTIESPNSATVGYIGSMTQTNTSIGPGDLASLRDYLSSCGVSDDDLRDLNSAIEADRDSREQPGNETKSWIGRMMSKIGTGTASAGGAASGQLIVDAVNRFLGIA